VTVYDLTQDAVTTSGTHFYLYYALNKAEGDYLDIYKEMERFNPEKEYPGHEPKVAYYLAFSRKIFRAEVSIVLIASSLVEAMANVFLSQHATSETFSILERATPIEKWETLPKLYIQGYSLPKGGCTYNILKLLNKRRNCLTHPKPRMEKGDFILHKGNLFERTTDEYKLHQDFCALPSMLIENMKNHDMRAASNLDIMFLMSSEIGNPLFK
jgi:hypothetical protein